MISTTVANFQLSSCDNLPLYQTSMMAQLPFVTNFASKSVTAVVRFVVSPPGQIPISIYRELYFS